MGYSVAGSNMSGVMGVSAGMGTAASRGPTMSYNLMNASGPATAAATKACFA